MKIFLRDTTEYKYNNFRLKIVETFFAVLLSTYAIMVVAEFGDKTNIIALSLMSKSKHPYFVALMSTIGITLSTVLSVLVGLFIGQNFPLDPIRYATAIIFILLGISSLREDDGEETEDDEEIDTDSVPWYKPVYLVALAEFGDKSQLFAISAAASTSALAVFFGATLGMATIMFGTALFGSFIFEKLDQETISKIAAALFIIAGFWIGISTLIG